jgi:hypothetical protein
MSRMRKTATSLPSMVFEPRFAQHDAEFFSPLSNPRIWF